IAIVYQSLDSQRADLAHGVFAVGEDIPDGILWIDSSAFAEHSLDFWTELMNQTNALVPLRAEQAVRSKLFVYRTGDLSQLRDEIKEFWHAVFLFMHYLIPFPHQSDLMM